MSVLEAEGRLGAYGLELLGVEEAAPLLVPCLPHWSPVRLETVTGHGGPEVESIDDDVAWLPLRTGGGLVVERAKGLASFTTPEPLSDAELVHPYLAPVVAVTARWLGRNAFHAGAFEHGGGAWVVFGDQGDGKSSLLAALALAGNSVVADDVVVVLGDRVCAGPRSVDLREDAAHALGGGEHIGLLGFRERWRVPLGPIESELPLSGWIALEWSPKLETARLPAPVLLQHLLGFHMLEVEPRSRAHLVDMLRFPAFVLRRPRELSLMGDAVECLLGSLPDARSTS